MLLLLVLWMHNNRAYVRLHQEFSLRLTHCVTMHVFPLLFCSRDSMKTGHCCLLQSDMLYFFTQSNSKTVTIMNCCKGAHPLCQVSVYCYLLLGPQDSNPLLFQYACASFKIIQIQLMSCGPNAHACSQVSVYCHLSLWPQDYNLSFVQDQQIQLQ